MHRRALTVGLILVMIVLVVGTPGWAAPQPQAQSVVTYPTSGMTVSGVVEVRGTATHPAMNSYQLRYAAGPEPTGGSHWVDFAVVQGTPVQNGVLGAWDTTIIPDGQYTLALAVWGVDDPSSPHVHFVTYLTVSNPQPVETPTPEEPASIATIGPTPTSVALEQPAPPTPRPPPTPQEDEAGEIATPLEGDDEPTSLALDVDGLRAAFCKGSSITVLLLGSWGLYLLAKAGVRWLLRQRARPPSR